MVDNEHAIAELLYTMWRAEDAVEFEELPKTHQSRWVRLAFFMLGREVELIQRLAKDGYRDKFSQKLIDRLDRWSPSQLMIKRSDKTVVVRKVDRVAFGAKRQE